MPDRSELVADAAMTVLARDGLRGLTHRAVDAEAALPDGSTSSCFRSRTALLEAILARLEELDVAAMTTGPQPDMTSTPAVAAHFAGKVDDLSPARASDPRPHGAVA